MLLKFLLWAICTTSFLVFLLKSSNFNIYFDFLSLLRKLVRLVFSVVGVDPLRLIRLIFQVSFLELLEFVLFLANFSVLLRSDSNLYDQFSQS